MYLCFVVQRWVQVIADWSHGVLGHKWAWFRNDVTDVTKEERKLKLHFGEEASTTQPG